MDLWLWSLYFLPVSGALRVLPEIKLEGVLGGSIVIECPLPETPVRLYLCRTMALSGTCTTVVSNKNFVLEEFKHRVTLELCPDRKLFLVEITGHSGKKIRCRSLQHGLIGFSKCICLLLGSRRLHMPALSNSYPKSLQPTPRSGVQDARARIPRPDPCRPGFHPAGTSGAAGEKGLSKEESSLQAGPPTGSEDARPGSLPAATHIAESAHPK
uniref:Uncharacterized protein n=1 Tax=Sus scrofa TaxID=9823 RepID=A0A8D1MKL8_PIG